MNLYIIPLALGPGQLVLIAVVISYYLVVVEKLVN